MDLKKIADIYQLSPLQKYELGRHLKTWPAEARLAWWNMTKWWNASDGACANTFSASSFLQSFNQT
jgi:hypothetical protein